MNVTNMTAEIYKILGEPSTHPDLTSTVLLGYLKEAHNELAIRSRCYRRKHIIPPIIQAKATGTITIDLSNVVEDDTVTVNGTVYTFKATPTLPFHVKIGSDFNDSEYNLTNAINGSCDGTNVLTGTFASPYVVASYVPNEIIG